MAERKVHKQELPNKKEPTPTEKKAKDLRAAGHSLNEIAEMLNISRKVVEGILAAKKSGFGTGPHPLGDNAKISSGKSAKGK
ncbi:hypothetical protein KA005_23410 [bacterium]|nr:hypothetical protein [bacterium]